MKALEYPIKMMHAYPSVNVGWGAHTMVGNDAKALGMTNALIVTTGLRGTGIVETIQGVLKAAGVASEVFAKVTPNPKDHRSHGRRQGPGRRQVRRHDQPRRRQLPPTAARPSNWFTAMTARMSAPSKALSRPPRTTRFPSSPSTPPRGPVRKSPASRSSTTPTRSTRWRCSIPTARRASRSTTR